MATIIVEDGSGLTTSNSYVTEAEVSTWATDRGITLTDTVAVLIIKGMDYLETLFYIGDKYTEAQALQWPRDGVVIDDFLIERETIPNELKDAQLALCMTLDSGGDDFDPMGILERSTKKEKVGDIEVEYKDGSASREIPISVNRFLQKLIKDGTSGTGFNVSRG